MNKSPVHVPEVPGIDLDYRPRNYFWAADLKVPLTSDIDGETRRQMVRALVEAGSPVPDGLDAAVLDKTMREAWGAVHPSHLGGEYLPRRRKDEVEIARISLRSVTADQISLRARRLVGRIGYRIVDEYSSTYVCHPANSVSPLSLRELIALMESACEGGSIISHTWHDFARLQTGSAGDVHHRHLGLLLRSSALLPRADRCLARRAGTGEIR